MTLKDLNIPDIERLEAMSDKEIEEHFAPFLKVCRVDVVTGESPAAKKAKPAKLSKAEKSSAALEALKKMAAEHGFDPGILKV